jgi:hypothetical protein
MAKLYEEQGQTLPYIDTDKVARAPKDSSHSNPYDTSVLKKNTENNMHTENTVYLASKLNDQNLYNEAKEIVAEHDREGYMSDANKKRRDTLNGRLHEKIKTKYGEQVYQEVRGNM